MLSARQWIAFIVSLTAVCMTAVMVTVLVGQRDTRAAAPSSTAHQQDVESVSFTLPPVISRAMAANNIQELAVGENWRDKGNRFALSITTPELSLNYRARHPDKVPLSVVRTVAGTYRVTVKASDLRGAGITVDLAKRFAEYAGQKSIKAVARKSASAGRITW